MEWVPAERVYAVFEEVAALESIGFQRIRKGFFARQTNGDITHVFRLDPYKGYRYGFTWGLSLAFMPHEWERKVRFHRTVKSARLDLFEKAHEEEERERGNEQNGFVSAMNGERQFQRGLVRAWDVAQPRALSWWTSTETVEGVLERAVQQVRRQPVSTDAFHWPRPALVIPFVLARLGRAEDAARELDGFIAQRARDMGPLERDNLRSALQRVGPI